MKLVFANAVVRADCQGHPRRVSSVCLTASRALSGSLDKTLRLWDVPKVLSVAVSPDSRWAATYDRRVLLWELTWK